MTQMRTRWAGLALGAAGVLLAASTTVWPVKVVAVRVPEVGDFTKGYEQLIWSWGREVVYTSDGVLLDAFSGPNPVPRLGLLVLVLVLATSGLLARLVRPGWRGELASAAGTALALGTVAASVVERLSVDDRSIGLQPGLVVVTTTIGWLEVVSVVLLTAALGVLVVPVLLPRVAQSLSVRAAAAAARLRGRRTAGVDGDAGVPGSGGAGHEGRPPPLVANLLEPGSVGSGRAPAVGFSDTHPRTRPDEGEQPPPGPGR